MANSSMTIPANVRVAGSFSCETMAIPSGTLTNAGVAAGANLDADKLEHRFRVLFNQVHGSAATAERRPVFQANGTGVINRVSAGSVVACVGGATITVDVKKNGTTVLTASIVLDNGNTAYVAEDGTLSVTALAANDILEVAVTVATGGGTLGQGLFVVLDIDENGA